MINIYIYFNERHVIEQWDKYTSPPLKKERNKEREVNLNSESMAQSSTSEHIVYKNMRNKLSKNL